MAAEDLEGNLTNYKLQLLQVETALTSDTGNEELLKLKKDLEEVITLTEELIINSLVSAEAGTSDAQSVISGERQEWSVGDKCLALYSPDGQYYDAIVEEILDDGSCTVTFDNYGNSDITKVSLLKVCDTSKKRANEETSAQGSKKPKSKKDQAVAEREYKRKKAQKKAQRMKQLEEEKESEKNKWLDFNQKTFSKTNKGRVKKSIFATPDLNTGRVGVGTCGHSGKTMTEYQRQMKWKK